MSGWWMDAPLSVRNGRSSFVFAFPHGTPMRAKRRFANVVAALGFLVATTTPSASGTDAPITPSHALALLRSCLWNKGRGLAEALAR